VRDILPVGRISWSSVEWSTFVKESFQVDVHNILITSILPVPAGGMFFRACVPPYGCFFRAESIAEFLESVSSYLVQVATCLPLVEANLSHYCGAPNNLVFSIILGICTPLKVWVHTCGENGKKYMSCVLPLQIGERSP